GTLINADLQSAENPYHTAIDPETDQYGIVDNSGNWIVEPQYYLLEHIDSLFFRGNKIEDYKDNGFYTYKLDVDAKALQYEYNIVDTLYAKYYLISIDENAKKIGVMDKNGNIIIAPSKGWIDAPFPGFFTVKDTLTALYDGEGKILLPQRYSRIEIIRGYIYATQY
ncbi:WG repeat-containing protein, partial [Dysgonomonas sp. GY617]|uniref:WG repeat-containing protein n=1 Tax=Dysgonomonas sp. GY617 TaxID=2780420 RepID=UPI001884888A